MNKKFYSGKKVLIYGASGGLGTALCVELCGKVAHLILAGRSLKKLLALQRHLEARCGRATALEIWVVSGSMAEFAARICQEELDGLLVATGKTLYQKFCCESGEKNSQREWGDYKELLDVNLTSVLQLALILLPYFRQRQGFFHIAGSYACLFPVPYQAIYAASKAALLSFVRAVTREQQAEFGRTNVRGLLSISLIGGMATNMYYQSDLHKQFGKFEKIMLTAPRKVAASLLKGIAKKRPIITVRLSGFWVYHVLASLPAGWISSALLWAYRPKK